MVQTNRRAGLVLLCYASVLLALSLYPWQLGPRHPFLVWFAPQSNREIADVIGNVWVYALLGALVVSWLERGARGLIGATLLGAITSGAVEFAQQWIASRNANGVDIAANVTGAALGATVAWATSGRRLDPSRSLAPVSPGGRVLLGLWILWQAYPFLPVFRTSRAWEALDQLRTFEWSWAEQMPVFFGFLILSAAVGSTLWRLLVLAALPAQALLIGRTLSPPSVLAAAMAAGIWHLAARHIPFVPGMIRTAALLFLIATELRPFHFEPLPGQMLLLPFESLFSIGTGSYQVPVLAKLYIYTALLWTLCQTGWRLRSAALAEGATLLACEVFQRWIPGRTSELTTDVAIMLAGVLLLWWLAGTPETGRADDDFRVRSPVAKPPFPIATPKQL
jgi:VanZ family protein